MHLTRPSLRVSYPCARRGGGALAGGAEGSSDVAGVGVGPPLPALADDKYVGGDKCTIC